MSAPVRLSASVSTAPEFDALAELAPAPRPPPELLRLATSDQTTEVAAALIEQLEHRRVELDAVLWPIAALGPVPDPLWPPRHRTDGRPS